LKAKYQHYGNDCIIYDQVICEDNIVVTVQTIRGCCIDAEPQTTVTVCLTNSEARRGFVLLCDKLEKNGYECVYKEC